MALALDELVAMGLFAHVVELRSFTEAARRSGFSKSVVSRRIAALEDRLGTRLLNRTTRSLSLTESGAAFYERCARMLAEAADAEDAAAALSREPRGLLRVSAPVSLCHLVLMPAFAAFLNEYPSVKLDISASDRMDDVIADGFDVALRIGLLPDSSLVARRLADVPLVVVASPAYLERRGRPAHPGDLIHHVILRYTGVPAHREWFFENMDGPSTIVPVGSFQTDSGTVLREAVRAGIGVAVLPRFIAGDLLRRGELEEVLTGYSLLKRGLFAVLPHRRNLAPKITVFISFIAKWLEVRGLTIPTDPSTSNARVRVRA